MRQDFEKGGVTIFDLQPHWIEDLGHPLVMWWSDRCAAGTADWSVRMPSFCPNNMMLNIPNGYLAHP